MPAITFNADEVFTMAERIEQNGAKFYRAAAKKFPVHQAMLEKLAAMEDGHYQVFKSMHQQITETETELDAADPEGQMAALAQDWADGHVFNFKQDPLKLLAGLKTLLDVLKAAIGLEKDSIVFYLGMKAMVAKAAGQERLDAIIAEEMRHIALLDGWARENTNQ